MLHICSQFLVICLFVFGTTSFKLQPCRHHRYHNLVMSSSGKKKVVVTGLGAITPVGMGATASYRAMCDGKSGIVRLPAWADEFPAKLGGVVQNFDPVASGLSKLTVSRNARYTQFALIAAREAIKDAKLDVHKIDQDRFGCIIGTGIGGAEWWEKTCNGFQSAGEGAAGLRTIDPIFVPAFLTNTAVGMVAMDHKARGPSYCVSTACASGTHSIGSALKHLRDGDADVMIAGGSEATLFSVCFGGFCSIRAMCFNCNDHPEKASRPFDKDRSGFVMSEGCGLLLLETEEHALARGADIYCELSGYGANCDAHHITAPAPEGIGLQKCMELALRDSSVAKQDVGYINAHGTSTSMNDQIETQAIKSVFGEHAYKLKVSSIKSMIGHSLGAAGGIEAVVCAKIFKEGVVPPTMNCDNPDIAAGCDLDYVPNTAHRYEAQDIPKAILSNSLGFGGHNAALVFKKYEAQYTMWYSASSKFFSF